jgi:predicted transcriptional regulator
VSDTATAGFTHTDTMVSTLVALKSGGWWTPGEIARRINDKLGAIETTVAELRDRGFLERRHLGSDNNGDLFAYRMREGA